MAAASSSVAPSRKAERPCARLAPRAAALEPRERAFWPRLVGPVWTPHRHLPPFELLYACLVSPWSPHAGTFARRWHALAAVHSDPRAPVRSPAAAQLAPHFGAAGMLSLRQPAARIPHERFNRAAGTRHEAAGGKRGCAPRAWRLLQPSVPPFSLGGGGGWAVPMHAPPGT
ncbi:MAG: hypothetical protein J3K34DRAFT_431630 [Monoraphidium minutum]|nr:MAG: hypothetical protein J3K34DRAFT_431630 [Monoraphidium minutum]